MAIPIVLDHGSGQSLQGQIFEQLRHLILAGRLKPGTPIPASRVLAEQLGTSRNTVLLVYDRLIAEGYLQARKAIGTYVNLELPETCLAATRRIATSAPIHGEAVKHPVIPFVGQMPARNLQHLDFDFYPDRIDPDLFPHKIWRRFINKTFTSTSKHFNFTEYCDPGGLPQLREVIADHLGVARGISVSSDQIIITAGSQEGLNLAARLTCEGWHISRYGKSLLSGGRFPLRKLLCKINSGTRGWVGIGRRAIAKGRSNTFVCYPFSSISSWLHIAD